MNPKWETFEARRNAWFEATRSRIHEVIDENGVGRIPQFSAPWREPVWILPALYSGSQEYVDLANRVVENFVNKKFDGKPSNHPEQSGREFGIFQSNGFARCLHRYAHLLTPAAREVMEFHARMVCRTFQGSAQPDYKFHGANDNMPMMATAGLLAAGEALGVPEAVAHARWNLCQLRRQLSRSAWVSEFNSSTYSAITLTCAAKIASYAGDPEIRELAREIEERIWAELLLHYHPSTGMQAGPQCRAYAADVAGHTHIVQVLFWAAFGSEFTGRDPLQTYFRPDGVEILHFGGQPFQSIAEYCDLLATDLHVPDNLRWLVTGRTYPAILRGRSECMSRFQGFAAPYHTETYMEEDFSVGTVNGPLVGGEQTASCFVTYKRKPGPATFRDAGTVFCRYHLSGSLPPERESSFEGAFESDRHIPNQGWFYAIQKGNVALLLATPHLGHFPLESDGLHLSLVFPAHFGRIRRAILGAGPVAEGAQGTSEEVCSASVETGEVFMHLEPLLPTSLPRGHALRFSKGERYEALDLINYEGESRAFTREQAALVLNGFVLTVDSKSKFGSLEKFHADRSSGRVQDYVHSAHRFVVFQRKDVEFEVVLTPDPFGVQTECIDGRPVPRPVFESNQIEVSRLPFMAGDVPSSELFFPWPALDISWCPSAPWIIGSRGKAGEANYARRKENLEFGS